MKYRRRIIMTAVLCVHILIPVGSYLHALPERNQIDDAKEESTDDRTRSSDQKDDLVGEKKIFRLGGHFKDLFVYTKTDEYSEYWYRPDNRRKRLISDLKRIRLSPEISISDILHVRVDYDNEVITGSYLKSSEFDRYWRPSEHNDLFDLSKEPHYDQDIYYRTKIHRAYAKLVAGNVTVTAGRQQIRFGSGRLWNPLDILNPVLPTFVEGAEEQKGTDALRVEYYPNDRTEISLVLDQKRINDNDDPSKLNSRNSNVLTRVKTTVFKTDIAALGGRVSRRNVGGADIASILFDGMLRGAVIYSQPEQGDAFLQAGGGYEYTFAFGLSFLIEYFYNQSGINFDPELAEAYYGSLLSGIHEGNYYILSNRFITMNRHYTGIAIGYDITPLLRGDLFSIYDYQGRGLFFSGMLKYSALQNLELEIGYMKGHVFRNGSYESDFAYLEKYGLLSASLAWYF